MTRWRATPGAERGFRFDTIRRGDHELRVMERRHRFPNVVTRIARDGDIPYRTFHPSGLPVTQERPAAADPNPQEPHAP